MRSPANQEPTGGPFIRRRAVARPQQTRLTPFTSHVCEQCRKQIGRQHPHRRDRLVFRRLHPLPGTQCGQIVVLMMFAILRRPIVFMIGTILTTQPRVQRPAIRHTGMFRGHVPGGKEPAKQRQQSEDAMERAHGGPIRGTMPCCQQRCASWVRRSRGSTSCRSTSLCRPRLRRRGGLGRRPCRPRRAGFRVSLRCRFRLSRCSSR